MTSYLSQCVDRVRTYMDEVSDDAKYTDNSILKDFVKPAITEMFARIANSSQQPVVCAYDFTMPANKDTVQLPPNIAQVWRVLTLNEEGEADNEIRRFHDLSVQGYNYRVEGTSLRLQFDQDEDIDFRILYLPSGDADWHYSGATSLGTAATADDESTLILSSDPGMGIIGRRLNEYGGASLRTFPSVGLFEERVVDTSSYVSSNYVLNLREAFNAVDGTVEYEVVPPGPSTMWDAIAWLSCIHLGVTRNVTEKKMRWLSEKYKGAYKTCTEQAGNFDGRDGKIFDDGTQDNQDYILWY